MTASATSSAGTASRFEISAPSYGSRSRTPAQQGVKGEEDSSIPARPVAATFQANWQAQMAALEANRESNLQDKQEGKQEGEQEGKQASKQAGNGCETRAVAKPAKVGAGGIGAESNLRQNSAAGFESSSELVLESGQRTAGDQSTLSSSGTWPEFGSRNVSPDPRAQTAPAAPAASLRASGTRVPTALESPNVPAAEQSAVLGRGAGSDPSRARAAGSTGSANQRLAPSHQSATSSDPSAISSLLLVPVPLMAPPVAPPALPTPGAGNDVGLLAPHSSRPVADSSDDLGSYPLWADSAAFKVTGSIKPSASSDSETGTIGPGNGTGPSRVATPVAFDSHVDEGVVQGARSAAVAHPPMLSVSTVKAGSGNAGSAAAGLLEESAMTTAVDVKRLSAEPFENPSTTQTAVSAIPAHPALSGLPGSQSSASFPAVPGVEAPSRGDAPASLNDTSSLSPIAGSENGLAIGSATNLPASSTAVTARRAAGVTAKGTLPSNAQAGQHIAAGGLNLTPMQDHAGSREPLRSASGDVASGAGDHDAFRALDGESSPGALTWTQASAHRAEAGFEDPELGWVAVRADRSGSEVHASLVPGSAQAALELGSHIDGLQSYLAAHQSSVESVRITAPQIRALAETNAGPGQDARQQTGQQSGQGAGQGSGQGSDHGSSQNSSQDLPTRDSPTGVSPITTDSIRSMAADLGPSTAGGSTSGTPTASRGAGRSVRSVNVLEAGGTRGTPAVRAAESGHISLIA